jgi:tRNA modification GTPase
LTSSEILRSGFHVGLAGFPNAGKSSLLNALLQRERALVSDTPGTTRDYIEETIHLHGIAIKLFDTAGLRDADNAIEIEGIRLAESLLKQCHLICVINDISQGKHHSDTIVDCLQAQFPQAQVILIQNKADIVAENTSANLKTHIVSAKHGDGMTHLKEYFYQQAADNTQRVNDALINARHAGLLEQVLQALARAVDAIDTAPSNEFIAIDVRDALKRIGEITGEVWSEDVLNDVFSKFCIGK